jgi:hypothetical protein
MQDVLVRAEYVQADNLILTQQTGTVQSVATSGTINTPRANSGASVIRVTDAGAVTAVILQAGTVAGQIVIIICEQAAANTITFAAAATSNVAGGAATSLAGLAAHMFVWDAVTAFWYQIGPLAN